MSGFFYSCGVLFAQIIKISLLINQEEFNFQKFEA